MPEAKEKKYKWRREDYRENTKGLLMVNTGDGKGKTTAALGLLVRAAGRGLNCCMIQFMKSKTDRYGEHESLEKLGVEVHTMGDGFTWDTKDPAQDIKTSEETWALCVEKLRSTEYELLVFDELDNPMWPGETVAALESVGLGRLALRRLEWDPYISYAVLD